MSAWGTSAKVRAKHVYVFVCARAYALKAMLSEEHTFMWCVCVRGQMSNACQMVKQAMLKTAQSTVNCLLSIRLLVVFRCSLCLTITE